MYLHHFFPNETEVPDSALLPIIERTLDEVNPRAWYAALMDYGSHLKSTVGNKSRASKHHTKQSAFAGSDRQIRGAIIRTLSTEGACTRKKLYSSLGAFQSERIDIQIEKLLTEGMVQKHGQKLSLPTK